MYTKRLWSDVATPASARDFYDRRVARATAMGQEAVDDGVKMREVVDNEWPDADMRVMRIGTLTLVMLRSRESVSGPKGSVCSLRACVFVRLIACTIRGQYCREPQLISFENCLKLMT